MAMYGKKFSSFADLDYKIIKFKVMGKYHQEIENRDVCVTWN